MWQLSRKEHGNLEHNIYYFSRFGVSFWKGVQRSISMKESGIQDPTFWLAKGNCWLAIQGHSILCLLKHLLTCMYFYGLAQLLLLSKFAYSESKKESFSCWCIFPCNFHTICVRAFISSLWYHVDCLLSGPSGYFWHQLSKGSYGCLWI